jgi:hypothetical protein
MNGQLKLGSRVGEASPRLRHSAALLATRVPAHVPPRNSTWVGTPARSMASRLRSLSRG